MSQVQVQNTAGNVISTVQVGQVDTTSTSLALVGQGVSPYAPYVDSNFVKVLENFANTIPPPNPITGQLWFNTTTNHPSLNVFLLGTWVRVGMGLSDAFIGVTRLPTATGIDFTVAGPVPIVTITDTTFFYHPTAVMLVPTLGSVNTAVSPPTFNLMISSSGDVMPDTVVTNFSGNKRAFYTIQGATRFAQNGDTISINVSTPAAGGTLKYSAFLFAFQTFTTIH
jgi:hypothetical protein